MNKRYSRANCIFTITIFLILICSPCAVWSVAKKYCTYINQENRELAELPSFKLGNYVNFSKEFDDYFNDHIPFRSYMITANTAIDYYVFNKSSNERVIVGEDGWLFLNRDDYEESDYYTDEMLAAINDNAIVTNRYFAGRGMKFILYIAPEKESVYRDKMPKNVTYSREYTPTEQLITYLQIFSGVTIVYPVQDLVDAVEKYDEKYFYKTDAHWNYLGGYFGAKSLLSEMGIPGIKYDDIQYTSVDMPSFAWHGYDQANLLGLNKLSEGDYAYQVDWKGKAQAYCDGDIYNSEEIFHSGVRYYSDAKDDRRVFLVRDSFAEGLMPYLTNEFSYIYSVHRYAVTQGQVAMEHPDIVIYEVAERDFNGVNFYDWPE